MNLELEGKRALVTGSTAGIGYAIAEGLAREGADVIVNGRSEERVEQAIRSIRSAYPQAKVEGLAADLGNADGVRVAVERLPDADILVNNLGIFEPKRFQEIPDEDWFHFFEVNVMSGVRLCRAGADSGRDDSLWHDENRAARDFTRLGGDDRGTGVTVNTALPGPTASEGANEFVDRMAALSKQTKAEFEAEFFRSVRPSSLLRRFARSDEVAPLVVFLCSPLSAATNGAALRADGGVVRSIL
jgi:NAD(P)-dependent dehydrogenase (short-subunit alcohol dehydrogenase family)